MVDQGLESALMTAYFEDQFQFLDSSVSERSLSLSAPLELFHIKRIFDLLEFDVADVLITHFTGVFIF